MGQSHFTQDKKSQVAKLDAQLVNREVQREESVTRLTW